MKFSQFWFMLQNPIVNLQISNAIQIYALHHCVSFIYVTDHTTQVTTSTS